VTESFTQYLNPFSFSGTSILSLTFSGTNGPVGGAHIEAINRKDDDKIKKYFIIVFIFSFL
jgi:hypothetical protein